MKLAKCTAVLCLGMIAPVVAATVNIEPIIRSLNSGRDSVPGRLAPFVFRGDNPVLPPSVNDAGQLVFRARSASNLDNNVGAATGIYAKRPGIPLAVLADTTADALGSPTFAVPGRPANTRFASFSPPLLNNAGDVLFQAAFSIPGQSTGTGSGYYSVNISGGPLVKITDTFTSVPGFPTATFRNFASGLGGVPIAAALNDAGKVVYWADFLIPPAVFPSITTAIFGTTVAGGAGTRLVDSTQTISPVSVPVGANAGFRDVRPTMAINSGGTVAFAGNLGPSPSSRAGIFAVSVAGGPVTTVAFRLQPVPGRALNFTDTFDPAGNSLDINDAGVVIFRNNPTGAEFGHYAATPKAGGYVHSCILDTLGGLPIPGEIVPPAEFSGNSPVKVNELGQVGVYSFVINSPTSNQQGIFATDGDGLPMSLVANLLSAPPGLTSPPARFNSFLQESAAINDLGNMTFRATGQVTISPSVGFNGLYFYDACAPELVRLSDSTISSSQLGGTFSTGNYDLWQLESAAGQHRSINKGNDVAFAAQFSNFEYGLYVAHVTTGSGGQLNIDCPNDVVADCPADTDPAATGSATATGCGTITIGHSDIIAAACGNTYSVTRTWTASNGSTTASCNQIISIVDTTGPVLAGVPDKASAECGAVPPPATVTATDGCDGTVAVVLSESSTEGPCAGTSIITRDWMATDACGNSTSGSHQICVLDSLDPGLMGVPGDVIVQCDAVPEPAMVTGADACDPMVDVSFAEVRTDGNCPDNYVLIRSWTATDECFNDVTASQSVTVQDTLAPAITCPAHATRECPADTSSSANGSASGSDNCGATSISSSDAVSSGCGTTQTITRTWTATDECDNASSCDQLVTVVDTVGPTITVNSAPITVTDSDCSGGESATLPSATATDACDGARPVTNNAPASFPAGTTTVTYSASDGCGNISTANVQVTVLNGAVIDVQADQHTVGSGSHPGSTKLPLVGILACAYDKTTSSCAQALCGGISHQQYQCIIDNCAPDGCDVTDSTGEALINVPPGNYIVVSGDATKTTLPDPLGVSVGEVHCGQVHTKYLQQIVRADGSKKPAKYTVLTGSLLLIIEPEYIVWDNTVQLYPFVFETIGDWTVTASVTPPEGFVADHEALTAEVDDELESVQFVITEVGSDLVPTETNFDVIHKGEHKTVRSKVGILLTPDYAKSRGFDVDTLKSKGLIVEPHGRQDAGHGHRAGSR
jgi:hypothetical protein